MLIGLTGGIGSGKSTVSKLFREKGVSIVDADQIAREVVEPERKAWKEIVQFFGIEILQENKEIDRKKLASLIFNDKEKRKKLNDITHPIIISEVMDRAKDLESNHNFVIVDIPLLFESKRETFFDLIIVVYVNRELQLERLMNRDKINKEEALSRINAQMSLEEKKEKADIVIYNDNDLDKTEEQINQIIKKLMESWI